MAQRYQNGHLRCAKRKRGPDVWEFLWRDREVDGKRRQRTLIVGTLQEFRTFREAQNQLHLLKANINADLPISSVATFDELAEHYCRTELLEENKTEKTRKTYQFYLRQWILPRWGGEYLHNMKTLHVEQWLRSLPGLANGSKAKIRNIMSAFLLTQSAGTY